MNFCKIRGRMAELGISQERLAKMLGISLQSLNAKLNERRQFTLEEVIKTIQLLDIANPNEYFFTDNIPNMQQNNRVEGEPKQRQEKN